MLEELQREEKLKTETETETETQEKEPLTLEKLQQQILSSVINDFSIDQEAIKPVLKSLAKTLKSEEKNPEEIENISDGISFSYDEQSNSLAISSEYDLSNDAVSALNVAAMKEIKSKYKVAAEIMGLHDSVSENNAAENSHTNRLIPEDTILTGEQVEQIQAKILEKLQAEFPMIESVQFREPEIEIRNVADITVNEEGKKVLARNEEGEIQRTEIEVTKLSASERAIANSIRSTVTAAESIGEIQAVTEDQDINLPLVFNYNPDAKTITIKAGEIMVAQYPTCEIDPQSKDIEPMVQQDEPKKFAGASR